MKFTRSNNNNNSDDDKLEILERRRPDLGPIFESKRVDKGGGEG